MDPITPDEIASTQLRADELCRALELFSFEATTSSDCSLQLSNCLRLTRDLRARLDGFAMRLTAAQFSPMEKAKTDLARILATKGGAK